MNVTDHQSIHVGQGSCEAGDFAEALWCILAADHYDMPEVDAAERLSGLILTIRSNFHVEVILSISSTSLTKDENHLIGITRDKCKDGMTVFWASAAGEILANLAPEPGESFPDVTARLMRICGHHLHRFSETEMFNHRPDLITKDDLVWIVDQSIMEGAIDCGDFYDGVEATDYFITQYDQE